MIEFTTEEKVTIVNHLKETADRNLSDEWYRILRMETTDILFKLIFSNHLAFGGILVLPNPIAGERLYRLTTESLVSPIGVMVYSLESNFQFPMSIANLDIALKNKTVSHITLQELQELELE
jgi:hypothetical protein